MLVHHPYPVPQSVSRGLDFNPFPPKKNLSGICLVQAEKDVHQGCLARPVFPEKRVNFSFLQDKIDPVVRLNLPEPLGDPLQLKYFGQLAVNSRNTSLSGLASVRQIDRLGGRRTTREKHQCKNGQNIGQHEHQLVGDLKPHGF